MSIPSNNKFSLSALFICGFRPFFVLAVICAISFIFIWMISLQGWLGGWKIAGGWVVWHAHELIYGFASAATAGFVLTAVPEFTRTKFIDLKPLTIIVSVWFLSRLAYFLSGYTGILPAAILNLVFWFLLITKIFPPVWGQAERKHISIAIVILLLMLIQLGFFLAISESILLVTPLKWLYFAVHLFMILIILAVSRVSVSVVNNLVESDKNIIDPDAKVYIARPARRNMAIASIILCAVSEFVLGGNSVTAWCALASMAAVLHLLNDWHIGKPLLNRYAILLYTAYWLMALGYGALSAAYFGAHILPSAARHLLLVGTMGLLIFTIMSIVGRIHSGLFLDRRPWLMIAAFVIVVASLVRVLAGVYFAMSWYIELLWIAAILWIMGFSLYATHFFSILFKSRIDNQYGCAGPKH